MAGNQNWRTPLELWEKICWRFGRHQAVPRGFMPPQPYFDVDFAANEGDSLCSIFKSDCLSELIPRGFTFCNPPWSLSAKLSARLREHQWGDADRFVMLCQNASSDKWFYEASLHASVFILNPRVVYVDPTAVGRKSQNGGSALLVFGDAPKTTEIWRWK